MSECSCCGVEFDSKTKKTKHHVVPKFMNPVKEVLIPLCTKCHRKLNNEYVRSQVKKVKEQFNKLPKNFKSFKEDYLLLTERFNNKEIHRGQFGKGLWDGLMGYLESIAK